MIARPLGLAIEIGAFGNSTLAWKKKSTPLPFAPVTSSRQKRSTTNHADGSFGAWLRDSAPLPAREGTRAFELI
jgi:hypothetical protein